MHVVGTAGHVDHGKSTLVEALTGIDPDRLREEKEREMTIVLGFAWLTLPNNEPVGIVDVPGHKDFIKNMLSGVGGIDAALLVIAGDEGIMPQTREHLAILDLLQVQGGVVALTKSDLVDDPEWLELVETDVMEQLEGTCLEDAPIVPVSAHTGDGLEALVLALQHCLEGIPPRPNLGRPRLSIDRVFTISGFGTVVTGTLVDGSLHVGQEVVILPEGHTARIRGLETHRSKIEIAYPGSRVAVNLVGVRKEQVRTGDLVTLPEWLQPTVLVDVQINYLSDAPSPLKHNTEVDFFCGATEIPARVRLLGAETLEPGETGWAQLRLSQPAALVRGDRFILRWLSPSITVGGGIVVDPAPRRRHRRFRPEVIDRLQMLTRGTPEEITLQALERGQPCEVRELVKRLSLPIEGITQALAEMLSDGRVLLVEDVEKAVGPIVRPESSARVLISGLGWRAIGERMQDVLQTYHERFPLRRGMPREELRSRLQERFPAMTGKVFNQVIDRAVSERTIEQSETNVWLVAHQVRFTPEQRKRVDGLLAGFRDAPYTTPSVSDCVSLVQEDLFAALLESGTLIKVSADVVYLAETIDDIRSRIVEHIRQEGSIDVAQVRDMLQASRKYAVSLLEYFDQQRVTKRVGDARVLR